MKTVERNLGLHQNGTYYSIFGGVPRTLRTKQISEARRLLKLRRERVVVKSTDTPADAPKAAAEPVEPTVAVVPPVVPPSNGEMAELKAMLANLTVQVADLAAKVFQPTTLRPLPDFEVFWAQNLATVRATVAKKSKKMYDSEAGRLLKTLHLYQRFERLRAFKATGVPAEAPTLWEIFHRLGPGGEWEFWDHRKKLGPSGLNQHRCYLRQFVEDAVDQEFLENRFLRLVYKIPLKTVDPDVPTIPKLDDMDALLDAIWSVDAECGRVTEFIAVTGVRPGAFDDIDWEDVDLSAALMHVAQDGQRPPVDLSEDAVALLLEIKGDLINPTGPILETTDYLLRKARRIMKQCVKALLPERPDLKDMTDLKSLRHYFASACVMRGIDFKTIALWLGHGDGGVLVAKTYGHLRRDHTKAAMATVQFSGRRRRK